MNQRLPEGTVALITGVARGQGRALAVRLAEEGADIIGVDAAQAVPSQGAPAASPDDVQQTVDEVEALGRRILTTHLNVRDLEPLTKFVEQSVAELGRLDVVVANAGVQGNPMPLTELGAAEWQNVMDSNLTGVFNTAKAALPHIIRAERGGSVIITSSSIALRAQPNLGPYGAAKTGLIGLMRTLALECASHSIRVNSLHPTTVATPMLHNPVNFRLFRPDLDDPQLADVEPVYRTLNALPTPWVEPRDVANAALFLASPEARFVTGVALPVDAGYALL